MARFQKQNQEFEELREIRSEKPGALLPSRSGALLVIVAALCLTTILGPLDEVGWQKDPLGRIPPGREAKIQSWVHILEKAGHAYENAQIRRESITLSGEGLPCSITLGRPGLAPSAPRTASFSVLGTESSEEKRKSTACKEIAHKVAASLQPHDDGDFFKQARGERIRTRKKSDQLGPEPAPIVRYIVEYCCWLILLFGSWTVLKSIVINLFRQTPSRLDPWIPSSTLVAIFTRAALAPAGPVHANEHGILELLSYTPASFVPGHSLPIGLYGLGGDSIFRVLATLSGLSGSNLLVFAALVLGLATPLIGTALGAMGCTRFASRLGMASYALSPFIIRAAPTESPLMLAALLALWGYLLIHQALSRSKAPWIPLFMGCAMITLAVQVHLVTLCWLLPMLFIPALSEARTRKLSIFASVMTISLCAPHAYHIVKTFLIGGTRGINPGIRFIEQIGEPAITLLNPSILPFAWLPLGIWGLLKLEGHLRALSWFVLVPLLLLSVSVSQNFSDVLRYQAPVALCFLLLSSYAVEELRHRAETLAERKIYQGVLVASIVLTAGMTAPVATINEPESALARTFEEASRKGLLDQGVIVPTPSSDKSRKRPVALPAWSLSAEAPRFNPAAPYVLLGTRCIQTPSEAPGDYPPLDPACARAIDDPAQAVLTTDEIPGEFAGLQVWFMVPRNGAPPPGLYRARQ